jgi:hypothetical protein
MANGVSTTVETVPASVPQKRRTQMLKIHLASVAARKAGLLNPDIIKVDNYEWITNINRKMHYLIVIVAQVLGAPPAEIKLSIQPDGEWREENSKNWIPVKGGDEIASGVYLAYVRPGTTDSLFCLSCRTF